MIARLAQIDLEIAEVERMILLKNKTIFFALRRGEDTASQEKQVGLLNKSLQVKKGRRRKVLTELNLLAGRCPTQQRAAKL